MEEIKQSDGRNQVKRKLLIYSRLGFSTMEFIARSEEQEDLKDQPRVRHDEGVVRYSEEVRHCSLMSVKLIYF